MFKLAVGRRVALKITEHRERNMTSNLNQERLGL